MTDEKQDQRWECPYCAYTLICDAEVFEAHVKAHKTDKKVTIDLSKPPTLDESVCFTGFWSMGDVEKAIRYLRSAYTSRYRYEIIRTHKINRGKVIPSEKIDSTEEK